jgi:hypothetical protein
MLMAAVIFSAVSQQVAVRQHATRMQQRLWAPETTETTVGGVRAVGTGTRLEVSSTEAVRAVDREDLKQAGTLYLVAKTGEHVALAGATIGVAMVTGLEAADFVEAAPPADSPDAWVAESRIEIDPEAPPTYIATFILATNGDSLFDRVSITAYDLQGVPLQPFASGGRREAWGGRLLFLTYGEALPSDVQFLEITPLDELPPSAAASGIVSAERGENAGDPDGGSPGDEATGGLPAGQRDTEQEEATSSEPLAPAATATTDDGALSDTTPDAAEVES